MAHDPENESQDSRRHEEDIKHHPHGEEAESRERTNKHVQETDDVDNRQKR